jgi:hypothetical protein
MRPLARRLFVSVFAALFGSIALVGHGLHALVEHEFHHPPVAETACHHACPADGASEAERDRCGVTAASHDEHACPICSYFAQAQRAACPQSVDFEITSSRVSPAARLVVWTAWVGVYHSRAPPAGSPIA